MATGSPTFDLTRSFRTFTGHARQLNGRLIGVLRGWLARIY
ncbi:MAG TPA: hypothetical protein VND98_05070 [Solirubrobacterales bacterium]|nr:hypothetical protein [Solirubrobacterales bacterium]